MKKLLYVNHGLGSRCGVYDMGVRHFNAIKESDQYESYSIEITDFGGYYHYYNVIHPDVVIFNYMPVIMPWLGYNVATLPTKRVWVNHLYDYSSVADQMNSNQGVFDYMICLDPGMKRKHPKIFAMDRPIYPNEYTPIAMDGPVHIGSFGFALPHKQFPLIMREINASFDSAVFNLHMTEGDFTGNYIDVLSEQVEAEITKPGISANVTTDYRTESEIVEMLSKNHINALFYGLPPENVGRSSSLDFMIAAQRPILVTHCGSFAHVEENTPIYPHVKFHEIMENYELYDEKARNLYTSLKGDLVRQTEAMLEKIL